ncbi:MAG: phosphoenolpyruvate--protein phosphotransferase [Elusimicrobia bacterium RIFCSPHIGHO2_01_FULL_64_10]|nr:MAG: phosphoenolpyruvate--protein phosphotransferase [Elusimicrobia bacterium RIFCSPHIGHO2_01_FULL_64_10]
MTTSIQHGIAASAGIGIGKVFLLQEDELIVVRTPTPKEDVKKEILRFRKALDKTRKGMEHDKDEMLRLLGKSHARLADAYLLILEDPILTKDVERLIAKELVNAEYAVQSSLEKVSHAFDILIDEYFRERKNDILEVGKKLLRNLLGIEKKNLGEMTEESIVVAHNLLPSDTVSLKNNLVRGFAINIGGKTSHTALLAQGLEIPAVVGLKDISAKVRPGQIMIVDGSQGVVLVDPEPAVLQNYVREREILLRESQELTKLKDLPAQTLDGKRVELSANIETADEIPAVISHGAEGIGLFRTEYLFTNRPDLPEEEEQFQQYSRVAKQMLPYPTLFRTLDIGGDKLAPFIEDYTQERNPFLGLRALRFCLKNPEIFRTQLRALLRASAHGKTRIMFPMVSGIEDFREGKRILESVRAELVSEGVPIGDKIDIGAMIEVPSAALTADLIAQEADFLSIGTNDLIQYTLAVDRVNENVASLYEPMHLAILRLLRAVVDSAHACGKWVGMCGEMAADSNFTQLLLGLGIDELSVVPSSIPRIKKTIRSTDLAEAKRFAQEILSTTDFRAVREIFNRAKLKII